MNKRHLAASAALASALVLTACGSNGTDTASSPAGGGSSTSAETAGNDVDVAFLTGMKPHHEQAVEMADLILAKSPGADIEALATTIKAAQEPEIEQLDALLAEFDVETDSPDGHGGGHDGGHDMAEGSDMGMMSEQDMQALEGATGTQAEQLFLEGMLEHHEGAVEMSTEEIDGGEYPQAIELATTIKADQQAEISQMEQLLSRA